MRNVIFGGVALLIFVLGGFYLLSRNQTSTPPVSLSTKNEATASVKTAPGFQGKLLAGKAAPFLEFNQADYEKALSEGKIILLDFYANWCPICRGEEPAIHQGFDGLTSDQVIGFRVNFNDSETDQDEENLAKQFNVPYQHTKIILKNGEEFSRSSLSWDQETFRMELGKAL
ncbi:thioredoxin family protein [Candidatus Daviesbacteria bacterium]|nr:thioredoxin family protein [Candidatus Daviesbacteria bacterium]